MFSCLRGASDDEGRRSAQSTPRLSRAHRVRDGTSRDSQRSYGSVGSMENSRNRVRLNQDWTRELELYQQQQQQLQQQQQQQQQQQTHHHPSHHKKKKSKSVDTDNVKLGLDRAWESERIRGLEILYQSMERQKERQRQRGGSTDPPRGTAVGATKEAAHGARGRTKKKRKDRGKTASRSRSRSQSRDKLEHYLVDPPFRSAALVDPNFRLSQERLERRIDELNKQLLVEKHSSRRDKLTLARLQQEMARQKSERQLRETLMRELERERMLRLDAEQRLQVVAVENEAGKSRLQSLQEEFRKMEDMVRSMIQYKGKLDALKQEKTSLTINYENNIQKCRTHVSNLEHEVKILMAEIKKIESQCANCHLCNKDLTYRMTQSNSTQADGEGDKTKMLLERLKMLEAEKSALVLENENQRQQYEKCLDEIANQVVQALMSQKTLREECSKLQKRVQDLELQNKQLGQMFQQKLKLTSDSVLQSLALKRLANTSGQSTALTSGGCNSSTACFSTQTQVTYVNSPIPRLALHGNHASNHTDLGIGSFSEVSLDSLQSMCSDYNEQVHVEESLGKPQLSSPPPWLRDRVFQPGESPTSSIASPSTMMDNGTGSDITEHARRKLIGASSSSSSEHSGCSSRDTSSEQNRRLMANKSSVSANQEPHSSHTVNGHVTTPVVLEPRIIIDQTVSKSVSHRVQSSQGNSSGLGAERFPGMRIETEFPADKASPKVKHHQVGLNNTVPSIPSLTVTTPHPNSSGGYQGPTIDNKREDILRALTVLTDKGFHNKNQQYGNSKPSTNASDISPAHELLQLSDSFPQKFTIRDRDGLPRIQNNLFDDSDSDDSYSARPISKNFSATSTISLSELLDQGLDDMDTPNDENFSMDDFHLPDTDEEKTELSDGKNCGPHFQEMIKVGKAVMGVGSTSSLTSQSSRKSSSSQTSPSLEESAGCSCDLNSKSGAIEMKRTNSEKVVISESLGSENCSEKKESIIVPLNNQRSVVSCKPPLPRPLLRPNSLDLPASSSRSRSRSDQKVSEYSSSSCDSDSVSESDSVIGSEDSEPDDHSKSKNLKHITKSKGHKSPKSRAMKKSKKYKDGNSYHKDSPDPHSPKKADNELFNKQLQSSSRNLTDHKVGPQSPVLSNCVTKVSNTGGLSAPKIDRGDYVLLRIPGNLDKSSTGNETKPANLTAKLVNVCSKPRDSGVHSKLAPQGGASPESHPTTQVSVRHNITSSPDSAMQQSFSSSSSSSDNVLLDKPSFRDDGYHSNSTVSCTNTDSSHIDSFHTSQLSNKPVIGKLDGFSPSNQAEIHKASVWTRDGICQDMKEALERRESIGSGHSGTTADGKSLGLVSEMKAMFEQKSGHPREGNSMKGNRERRYSMPSTKDEEGDYVLLDPFWPPLVPTSTSPPESLSRSQERRPQSQPRELPSSSPSKPSRPKMGIHAKTRSLIQSQRDRAVQKTMLNTYPSDPCLCKRTESPSPKSDDSNPSTTRLKRTSSDSCLNNRLSSTPLEFVRPSHPHPRYNSDHAIHKVNSTQVNKSKLPKKERSRSVSALKTNKVSSSSKDKNQCVVGYVISEPQIPEFALDVKVPSMGTGYFRGCSEKEKGVRMNGEGSEHGYKSGDDSKAHKRPEAVGAISRPPVTETYDSSQQLSPLSFDVRKYKQLTGNSSGSSWHKENPTSPMNLSMWSSESDSDRSPGKVNLIPITIVSPSGNNANPSHQQVPLPSHHASVQPQDVVTRGGFSTHCDINSNKRRTPIMSYPPATTSSISDYQHFERDVQIGGTYHTMPVETKKPRIGNFKQLMENLAKKSEDVLKSKIFHSETCESTNPEADYDVMLNISFEDEPSSQPRAISGKSDSDDVQEEQDFNEITRQIENLTRTVDDLQRSMSSVDCEEEEGIPGSSLAGARGNYGAMSNRDCYLGNQERWSMVECGQDIGSLIQVPLSTRGLEESSSSCDDEVNEYVGVNSLGDSFVRKFRHRKKKSK